MAPKKGGKPVVDKKKTEKMVNSLFEKWPKQFGIEGALPPKKDLHPFVRWRQVVRIQRKRRILKQCLKVPPALNQFTKTLDKNFGFMVPDVPLEETEILRREASKQGIELVLLTTPTTPRERMRAIIEAFERFLYLVSAAGVTGAHVSVSDKVQSLLQEIKQETAQRVTVGFGIQNVSMSNRSMKETRDSKQDERQENRTYPCGADQESSKLAPP